MSTIRASVLARWWFRHGRSYVTYAILTAIACTMLLPFLWMVLSSFKPLNEVNELNPLPSKLDLEIFKPGNAPGPKQFFAYTRYLVANLTMRNWVPGNYRDVFKKIPFAKYYFNSLFVAAWVTLLVTWTSSMAAFAFSRLQWPGRDHVFKLYLATMMIPGVVTMIPNYWLMVKLHLVDSYLGLIVPAAFTAFGTFLLRQFMLTIPPSLDEAAMIDGASAWQVFADLILPLARPGIIVLTIFTFMGNYASFFWPLILISREHLRTLPIGMLYFDTEYAQDTTVLMAAAVMNVIPLIVLFLVMQKHLVKGIQLGAVKG
ncbi:MAG TPA: carbohydrate ABC transporter permease [Candidatus Hydrogenedentes bacterium]|nr:carbohydrate ABC transporter permease [Candidatus Hydrogenedentota bacterium]